MADQVIRQRCLEMIESLNVPDPFDLAEFIAELERRRGRPIRLITFPARSDAPCGLWVGAETTDYVLHADGTSPLHRDHIVLHELGHMLFGHEGGLSVDQLAQVLLPDLDPALVHRVLGRTAYTTPQEREAETFASLLLARRRPPAPAQADPRAEADTETDAQIDAEIVDRLEHAWGRPPTPPHRS